MIDTGKYIIKTLSPYTAAREALLTARAHEISNKTDWFYTPQIISFNDVDSIVLEKISNISSLRDLLELEIATETKVLVQVGKALAILHKELSIIDKYSCVHGDFNIINIAYQYDTARIIVFDWCLNPALSNSRQYSRLLDMASFLRAVLLQIKSLKKSTMLWRQRSVQFLSAYEQETCEKIDYSRLWAWLRFLQLRCMLKQFKQRKFISLLREIYGFVFFFLIKFRFKLQL
jgi:tRNA A-37 threonylcarbamoyl transferase component Bud32